MDKTLLGPRGSDLRTYTVISIFLVVWIGFLAEPVYPEQPSKSHPLNVHHSYQYTDDLNGLKKRRHIRVLTTLSKTNFFLQKGKIHGFEYELLKGYEKFLNDGIKRRELRIVLEFIPVSRGELLPKLVNGYGDIAAAGLTITDQRKRRVDFTMPYLNGVEELVITHRNGSKPIKIDDLTGRQVFVRKSSSYYDSLLKVNERLKESGKPEIEIVAADENLETEDILELVNSGAVDLTVCDSHIAAIWSGVFPNLVICEDLKLRAGGQIAWMIRKKSPLLMASLNGYLKKNKKGTLHGNIFFKRYYENNKWIKNPLAAKETQNFLKYRKLFRKYANRYDFDWMLIAALAYQESGLNNNKKSKSGAIGIMQVLPSTAKDKNIAISNFQRLENNVHAGVKYLAFLRKRYFSDPQIEPRNQVRFALAAYNAGPAKINRVRSLAKEMGLDSNRWFRHVELAALKIIGQETVRYVSNINKFYVIYMQASESFDARIREKKEIGTQGQ